MRKLLYPVLTVLVSVAAFSAPPHPTLVTVQYRNQLFPVVKVKRSDPVIRVENHEKRIRYQTTVVPQRVDAFGEGYVKLLRISAFTESGKVFAGDLFQTGRVEFQGILKSKTSMSGGFILLGISNVMDGPSKSALINTEFILREFPRLEAGKASKITFSHTLKNGKRGMDYFVQVFDSEGHEIMTNEVEKAWKYYALLEKVQHHDVMEKYLKIYADKNHQAFPVVRPKPVFPSNAQIPDHAHAILTVDPSGYVTDVVIEELDESLLKAAHQAFEGWLFMPQLESGKPISSRVQVPILF